jgi:hypothetical protein
MSPFSIIVKIYTKKPVPIFVDKKEPPGDRLKTFKNVRSFWVHGIKVNQQNLPMLLYVSVGING